MPCSIGYYFEFNSILKLPFESLQYGRYLHIREKASSTGHRQLFRGQALAVNDNVNDRAVGNSTGAVKEQSSVVDVVVKK